MDLEEIAGVFVELASEQRLSIITQLAEKKSNLSKLSELLDSTKPEVHRNISRLTKIGLIEKDSDGNYGLTTFGNIVLMQIPSFQFISANKKYFTTHTLKNLESKFIQRLGALLDKKQVTGFVRVLEEWKKIHNNAEKYICNILTEVPYSKDIIDIISSKLESGVPIRSIFTENTIVSEEREKIFNERGFKKYVQNGLLERKIGKNNDIVVLVTEKESAVFFPNLSNIADLSTMFTSTNPDFHDWCCDYFEWCWVNSTSFQESKLKS